MFTGIVKDIGRVKKIVKRVNLWRVGINCLRLYKESSLSDSISVNGVCLTLTEKKQDLLFFDIIKSTLENTNLKRLKIGSYVNIELSLKVGERVGGHFVLGHVDCESKIKSIKHKRDFYTFEIELPKRFKNLITEKGSIAVEGISLTLQEINPTSFAIDVIPYTFAHTNLKYKKVGDWVNLEFDYLLKSTINR